MKTFSKIVLPLLGSSLILLTGCATTRPVAYANLDPARQLRPNLQKDADRIPYSYSSQVDWRNYSAMVVEPVAIYGGPDHQFGKLPEADKQELARHMSIEFGKALGQRFKITDKIDQNTLRLKLTLTGTETNTAVVSTLIRFDPLVGIPTNLVQSARGKQGIFIGSVSYSVEIYDGTSNRLLKAFVAKQYPNAMNVSATFGSLGASEIGIVKGADELLAQLK